MKLAANLCLDCNSEAELVEVVANVYKLTIQHDETCPWLAQYTDRKQAQASSRNEAT